MFGNRCRWTVLRPKGLKLLRWYLSHPRGVALWVGELAATDHESLMDAWHPLCYWVPVLEAMFLTEVKQPSWTRLLEQYLELATSSETGMIPWVHWPPPPEYAAVLKECVGALYLVDDRYRLVVHSAKWSSDEMLAILREAAEKLAVGIVRDQ